MNMKKLSKQQIEQINELLQKGQGLPEEYKNLLFESKKEYELVYGGKEREEDIIAETMAVPLQPVKTLGKDGKDNGWVNKLIFGDNLQVLRSLYNDPEVKGKVKLIYIDQPFGTGDEYGFNESAGNSLKCLITLVLSFEYWWSRSMQLLLCL
jgi:site-specific DNA-methyltransferase (adenine-specific)/adenine-specific DNA-methyltransferase